MQQEHPGRRDEPDDVAANRQTARLGGVAIILLLPVVGPFLMCELRDKDPIEDCLIAGQMNCNLLAAPFLIHPQRYPGGGFATLRGHGASDERP